MWFDKYTDERLGSMNEVQLESLLDDIEYELSQYRETLWEIECEIDEWDGALAQDYNEPEGSFEFRSECRNAVKNLNTTYDEVRAERRALKAFLNRVETAFEATDYYRELQAANEAAMQHWYDAEEC